MRSTRDTKARTRRQSGAAAVEMALVLPVLILILLGIIEIANILRIQITLDSAATTMARSVSQDTSVTDEAEAQSEFSNDLDTLAPGVQQDKNTSNPANPPALTMSPATKPLCNSNSCDSFLITITYTYKALSTPMKPFFDNLVLTASSRRSPEPSGTAALGGQ